MKFTYLLLVCSLLVFPQFSSGKQPEKRHLFVEWRHWDSTIVLGALEGRKARLQIAPDGVGYPWST